MPFVNGQVLCNGELVADVVREVEDFGGRLAMVRIDRPMVSGESDPELFPELPDPALVYQPEPVRPEEPHFVELELVDQQQQPVGGLDYALTDPKAQEKAGKLGAGAYHYADPVPGGKYTFQVAEEKGEAEPEGDLEVESETLELEILLHDAQREAPG